MAIPSRTWMSSHRFPARGTLTEDGTAAAGPRTDFADPGALRQGPRDLVRQLRREEAHGSVQNAFRIGLLQLFLEGLRAKPVVFDPHVQRPYAEFLTVGDP